MSVLGALSLIAACLAMSAFFSGSETALMRLRRDQIRKDVGEGAEEDHGPGAVSARLLLRSPSRLLVTILFGNNVVNILCAAVASAVGVSLLGTGSGIAMATGVVTVAIFIFCEVIPKAIAARNPKRIAYLAATPLYLIHQALRPIHLAYDYLVEPLVRRIAGESDIDTTSHMEAILELTREAKQEGSDVPSINIIGATADAAQTTAGDIMVPRTEVVAFPATIGPSELLDTVLEEGFTRVPVYDTDIDHLLGIVHLKDLTKFVRQGGTDLRKILKPILKVPLKKPILELLADTQRAFVHFVQVQDEFGVTQGILTQEDILEELVGEIRDEFDKAELESIRAVSAHRWQALGGTKVHDFNRETGGHLESAAGETLAGLVFNAVGRLPRRGESICVGDYDIVVSELGRNRVTQVEVFVREPRAGEEGAKAKG